MQWGHAEIDLRGQNQRGMSRRITNKNVTNRVRKIKRQIGTYFKKMFFENMHCENILTKKQYPEFQLGNRRPKATAILEYLVQPAIKHHV